MVTHEPIVPEELERILARYMSPITARSVAALALKRAGTSERDLRHAGMSPELLDTIVAGTALYVRDPQKKAALTADLGSMAPAAQRTIEHTVEVTAESGIAIARGLARELADQIGFRDADQIKIGTVVSELARNIYRYAGRGRIQLVARTRPRARIEIIASDKGPGISNLDEILSGAYVSKTGLGRGLIGCRAIMDELSVDTRPGEGTRIYASKAVRR